MSASPAARAEAPIEGILWMFATTLSFAGVNIIVHHLGPAIPATQSAFLRFAFGIVLVLPGFMQIPRGGLPAKIWGLFGLRGALQAVAVLLWFYAMARVPIADVTAIGYLNPIVVTLGGALLLGEGFSWRRGLAIGVAMLGALVILRPGLREIQPGHVAQLCAALFFGVSYLEMKRLSRHAPAGLIVAMMTLTVAVCLLPFAIRDWVPMTAVQVGWLALNAAVATAGHYTMTRAFQAAPLTVTQPVVFLQLVWAALAGLLLFGEPVDPFVMLGGAMIIGAISYITWREARLKRSAVTPAPAQTKL